MINRLGCLVCVAVFSAAPSLMLAQAASTPTPAVPPGNPGDTVQLPAFTVSSESADRYRATDSLSAARIRGALIDTPATINVITQDFLHDVGANAIFDATQYVAGIGNGRLAGANGILDRQTFRGFESDGRSIDNFASKFQANIEPQLIERIEIVKGPNAILAPTGAPGGLLNVITKSPSDKASNKAIIEVAGFFGQKATLDSTGPVSFCRGLTYRTVASYQDTNTFQPGRLKQTNLNQVFAYKLSDRASVDLKYTYIEWTATGAASSPGNTWIADSSVKDGGYVGATPPAGFTYRDHGGIPDWAERADRLNRLSSQLTVALSDNVSMRLAAAYFSDYFDQDGAVESFPSQGARYNPSTGVYTPDYTWAYSASAGAYVPTFSAEYNPANVARAASIQRSWQEDAQYQNDFAGNFKFGSVSFAPVLGWSYQLNHNRTVDKSAAMPALNLFTGNYNTPKPSTYTAVDQPDSKNTKFQVYEFQRLGFFHDRLNLTAGVSRVWIDYVSLNEYSPSSYLELKGPHDTYLSGILYKVTPDIAAYYSFSNNANAVNFNGQPLWQTGKQHEFGLKTQFYNERLAFSVAHFQIAQTNLVTPNPVYIPGGGNPQYLLSNQTNHGYELELVGGLTKDLSVIASVTQMRLRDVFGRRVRNIPDSTANALLNYHFREGSLKGGNVSLGVTHVGDQAGETAPTSVTQLGVIKQVSFYVPARTILNAGAGYTVGNWTYNLNIDNLLNKRTVWQSSGRFSMSGYPTINGRLTVTTRF